jgi:hypothetical protein
MNVCLLEQRSKIQFIRSGKSRNGALEKTVSRLAVTGGAIRRTKPDVALHAIVFVCRAQVREALDYLDGVPVAQIHAAEREGCCIGARCVCDNLASAFVIGRQERPFECARVKNAGARCRFLVSHEGELVLVAKYHDLSGPRILGNNRKNCVKTILLGPKYRRKVRRVFSMRGAHE